MKLSEQHADRIDSIKWFSDELEEHAPDETASSAASELIELATQLARGLVRFADEAADAGRITAAIDNVRHALEDLIAAHQIGKAKKARIAAKPAEPSAQ
jgi:predicted TPR repeat methyltransferase